MTFKEEQLPLFGAPTVHVLRYGMTLCAFGVEHGVPGRWPEGHQWASVPDAAKANCEACLEALERLRAAMAANGIRI